jgi:hypothetical protein
LIGSVIGLAVASDGGEGPSAAIPLIVLGASAPIGLLIAGFKLRRRETRAWALHRLVDDHVEIPVSDLLSNSDFSEATLDRAIRDLNGAGVAFLVWDRETGVVQDGRLRNTRVQIEGCDACGVKVSLNLRVDEVSSARCPYCQHPLNAEDLLETRARLIDELDTDPTQPSRRRESGFSVALFIILTVVFWPFGVGYALWHWRASQTTD